MEDREATISALHALLGESFIHWNCAGGVRGYIADPSAPGIDPEIVYTRGSSPWLKVRRPPADGPIRWLVETDRPDPRTSRSRFPCTSVLDVLRTVRLLADPAFEPGHRIRMGAPGAA